MSPRRSLSRQWRTARAAVPRLPAWLVLIALNMCYFAWSYQLALVHRSSLPLEINPASIVALTPEEGRSLQLQAEAALAKRAKSASPMLLEYEDAPPKVVAPDR